ncbi:aminotransferase class IV [Hyphococcus sp.]|uniref:aminotransferase class IV n=1 Tax=Hyphococcus sp. TaxID=2038636 RepID=UPI002082D9B5|nr:MAG: 4-amino-4-deoxychorismate lyase [Marinicaulis sp.]
MSFWLNGEFREGAAAIDIADRGLLLGDGIFETLLLVDGAPVFLTAHIARMAAGALVLKMASRPEEQQIGAVITELAVRNGASSGLASARVTVTRGVGPRGIELAGCEFVETMLITVSAYEAPDASAPIELYVSQHRRNENSATAWCKTLNYLDNILARDEAMAAGADDAVMLNMAGRVACVSTANLFAIHEGAIVTPRVADGALPGTVRAALIDIATKEGLQIAEASVAHLDLNDASIFITNSLIGLRKARMAGAEVSGCTDDETFNRLKSCYEQSMRMDIDRRKAAS